MATQCYFLAKETSCGLIVQQVFLFFNMFSSSDQVKNQLQMLRNLSHQRKRKSTGVHEKCKVMFKGKRMQGDAVLRTSRSPWDMNHSTQMIRQ